MYQHCPYGYGEPWGPQVPYGMRCPAGYGNPYGYHVIPTSSGYRNVTYPPYYGIHPVYGGYGSYPGYGGYSGYRGYSGYGNPAYYQKSTYHPHSYSNYSTINTPGYHETQRDGRLGPIDYNLVRWR